MALEFTYTFDDLTEALAPEWRRQRSVGRVLGWWLITVLALAFLQRFNARPAAVPLSVSDRPPTQDFTLMLAPQITAAVFWLTVVLLSTFALHKRPKPAEIPRRRMKGPSAMVLPAVCSLLVIFNLVVLDGTWLSVQWRPSRADQLIGSYAVWLAALVVVAMTVRLSRKRTLRRTWNTKQSYRRLKRLEFDDNGFVMADDAVEHRVRWSALARYRETANLLLVYNEDSQRWFFPKRAFVDPAEMMRFRAMLQTHVIVGEFLPQDSAFPVVLVPVKPL